jgi:peptidoglycan/xylan/chitin deacetylase (PgdA/CDA1 family)
MPTPQQRRLMMGGGKFVTLPQNLLLSPGTLYEGFENKNDWTLSGTGATIADNTTQYKTGQSVKVSSGSGLLVKITKTVNWDFSGTFQQFRVWIYLHNTTLTDYGANPVIYLSETTDFSNSWKFTVMKSQFYQSGWNLLTCPKTWFVANAGSPNWANPIVRFRLEFTGDTGKVAEISFDDFYAGVSCVPTILLRFDDGYETYSSVALPYMQPRNIRGTVYMIGTWINAAPPDALSTAQLKAMQNAGWTIANHTHDHTNLTTLTEAQQEAEITGGVADLVAVGMTGGKYVAFPGGTWNADTITALNNTSSIGQGSRSSVHTGSSFYPPMVLPSYEIPCIYNLPSNTVASIALATIQGWIDDAIIIGSCLPIHFHDIDGVGGHISVADFQTLMDYIYIKAKAGLIYFLTIDDLYKLTLGPVRVPKVK